MRKFTKVGLILMISIIIVSCSKDNPTSATKDPEFLLMVEHTPTKQFYEIDLKTSYLDKWAETGVKNGSIAYINNQKWAKVVETGENFSLWIKDLARDKSNFPEITVSFNLELQEPSLVYEGKVYKKQHFEIKYDSENALETQKGNVEAQLVADRFMSYAKKCKAAGKISAHVNNMFLKSSPNPYSMVASKIIDYMVGKLGDEQSWQIKKIEAVICGSEVLGQLKEWLWELEN